MLKILLALASRHFGMSLTEMAEEAHIDPRSVYRYLHTLRECGVELTEGWGLDDYTQRRYRLYRLKTIRGVRLDLTRRA